MLTDWSVNISPSATPHEGLSGLIERVTFHSEETGFGVLRVKVKGHRELVTVVGTLASVNAGEWITAQGNWVRLVVEDSGPGIALEERANLFDRFHRAIELIGDDRANARNSAAAVVSGW